MGPRLGVSAMLHRRKRTQQGRFVMGKRDCIRDRQIDTSQSIIAQTFRQPHETPQNASTLVCAKKILEQVQQAATSRLTAGAGAEAERRNLRPWSEVGQRFVDNKTGVHFENPFRELGCNMLLKVWEEIAAERLTPKAR